METNSSKIAYNERKITCIGKTSKIALQVEYEDAFLGGYLKSISPRDYLTEIALKLSDQGFMSVAHSSGKRTQHKFNSTINAEELVGVGQGSRRYKDLRNYFVSGSYPNLTVILECDLEQWELRWGGVGISGHRLSNSYLDPRIYVADYRISPSIMRRILARLKKSHAMESLEKRILSLTNPIFKELRQSDNKCMEKLEFLKEITAEEFARDTQSGEETVQISN